MNLVRYTLGVVFAAMMVSGAPALAAKSESKPDPLYCPMSLFIWATFYEYECKFFMRYEKHGSWGILSLSDYEPVTSFDYALRFNDGSKFLVNASILADEDGFVPSLSWCSFEEESELCDLVPYPGLEPEPFTLEEFQNCQFAIKDFFDIMYEGIPDCN